MHGSYKLMLILELFSQLSANSLAVIFTNVTPPTDLVSCSCEINQKKHLSLKQCRRRFFFLSVFSPLLGLTIHQNKCASGMEFKTHFYFPLKCTLRPRVQGKMIWCIKVIKNAHCDSDFLSCGNRVNNSVLSYSDGNSGRSRVCV